MIQNHSIKHQLIRDNLTAMATIFIFVWIIFSYKLYKQIFMINFLGAAVWKLWHVWFNFSCFQHISKLSIRTLEYLGFIDLKIINESSCDVKGLYWSHGIQTNTFFCLSVSFWMIPCCKWYSIKTYLDTIQITWGRA